MPDTNYPEDVGKTGRAFFALLLTVSAVLSASQVVPRMATASTNFLNPVFLGDVNSEEGSSQLIEIGQTNGILVFQPNNSELWRSDGTLSGTYKLADVRQYSQSPASVNYSGFLYFVAESAQGGFAALWRTDGTVEGTTMVKQASQLTYYYSAKITVFESRIFVYFGQAGSHLWKSDGTASGTIEFLNVVPNSSYQVTDLIGLQDRLLISADVGTASKLFSTNGVSTSTNTLLENSDRGGRFSEGTGSYVFYGVGNRLYRISDDWSVGLLANSGGENLFNCGQRKCYFDSSNRLWATDGTSAGTAMVKSFILTDSDEGLARPPSTFQSKGYFSIEATDTSSVGVWETDGTQIGTRRISTAPASQGLAATSQYLYLHYRTSIRRWVGNVETVVRGNFVDTSSSFLNNNQYIGIMSNVGEKIFFSPTTRINGKELWVTSDENDSAALVRDITVTSEDNDTCSPRVTLDNGDVAAIGYSNATTGGIIRYSMSSQNSLLLEEEDLERRYGEISFSNLRKFGNSLLFVASGNPWITDGGIGNATMLKRVTNSQNAEVGPFVSSGSKSYFFAGDGTLNSPPTMGYIWRTDGTTLGTQQYVPAANAAYAISAGYLYFHKQNSQQVLGLWRMNLSNDSQSELLPGRFQIYPANGGVFLKGNSSFAFADPVANEVRVIESWSSQNVDGDGVPIGSVSESSVRAVSMGVFYARNTGSVEGGMKFSDGSVNGTTLISMGDPEALSSPFSSPKILRFEEDATSGLEPWLYDAQSRTRTLLKDASPGSTNSYFQDLGRDQLPPAVINGKLYFDMIVHGGGPDAYGGGGVSEIWETDGTPAGTRRITNFAQMQSGPRYTHCLFASGDFVYFGAFSDSHGRELWGIDTRALTSPSASSPVVQSTQVPSLPSASPSSPQASPSSPQSQSPLSGVPNLESGSTVSGVLPQTSSGNSSTPIATNAPLGSPIASPTLPLSTTSSTVPQGVVRIARAPSSALTKNLSLSVIGLKAAFSLEPPAVSSKGAAVTSYTVQLKPKSGKIITKTVLTRASKVVKISAVLTRKMTYQVTVIATQKSGKRLTWKGPALTGQ